MWKASVGMVTCCLLPRYIWQTSVGTMHQGGVFSTRTLEAASQEAESLRVVHADVLRALGMSRGVTHSEFISADTDGKFYFLEIAARVGGAYIEFASGLNPWVEWARLEVARLRGEEYSLLDLREDYAGSVICLARQEHPDTSSYSDPEIVYRLHKYHHAGLVVRSSSAGRVQTLIEEYSLRFLIDFYARMDAPDKPTA